MPERDSRQFYIVNRSLIAVLAFWALLQAALVVKVSLTAPWTGVQTFGYSLLSASSAVALFALWYTLAARLPGRWAARLSAIICIGYWLLWSYHWARLEPLSFVLLFKNSANALTWEALDYVLGSLSVLDGAGIGCAALLLAGLQWRWRLFTRARLAPGRGVHVVVLLAINLALALPFSSARNEVVEFIASAYQYWLPYRALSSSGSPYPYVQGRPDEGESAQAQRPSVFVVVLESFSSDYIDAEKNGKVVTPFFNQLKNQGLFVENFFSASVETSKGQFAALCSVYPSYRTNIFTSYPDNNFRCLSEILDERGYTNVFMKAFHTLSFENTGEFVANNHFPFAHAMDDNFVTASERDRHTIGWGIRDDLFYEKTFAYLDRLQENKAPDSPFFVTTMSVTNHMMFDDIPEDKRHIYPQPQSHEHNYANSMYLTDQYLRRFFELLEQRDYLEDSLVIVLGDNGFPMGQHGNYHNTKTVYNELFKTPLLVWWPGHVAPRRISDEARSQLDVAPTVTDLLDIEARHHFVGRSLLEPANASYFVPLIQPFDGTFLASIRYPYKFVHHLKTDQNFLYDLFEDPLEQNNLLENATQPPDGELLQRFAGDIARLRRNEQLLREDRIFPSREADGVRVQLARGRVERGQALGFHLLGQLREDQRIELTIEPKFAQSGPVHRFERAIAALKGTEIPPRYLHPGVNRVTFTVYADEKPLSSVSRDVYVVSERAALLTELPIAGEQAWGRLHINRSVRGGPLRVGGNVYDYGLGTHARSEHRIALEGRYRSLYLGYGLDDESTCGNGAEFRVYRDGREIHRSARMRNGQFADVVLDVSGAKQLTLQTRPAGNRACDHTNWLNPVLHRAATPTQLSARSD